MAYPGDIPFFSQCRAHGPARTDASEQLELFSRVETSLPEELCRISAVRVNVNLFG